MSPITSFKFQFQMVRLKAWWSSGRNNINNSISIPDGTIKSNRAHPDVVLPPRFQFQMVRLKAETRSKKGFDK